jgi:hypothetical protein
MGVVDNSIALFSFPYSITQPGSANRAGLVDRGFAGYAQALT